MELNTFEQIPSEILNKISIDENTFLNETAAGMEENEIIEPQPTAQPFTGNSDYQPPQPTASGLNIGQLITGENATELIDTFAPALLAMGLQIAISKRVKKSAFQLSASEKKTIAPIMQKCLEQLNLNFDNPFIALAAALGLVYGSKVVEVLSNSDTLETIEKKEAKNDFQITERKRGRGRPRKF